MKIHLTYCIFLESILISLAKNAAFIRDYFTFKNVPNIVSISCESAQEHFEQQRMFNSLYMSSTIWNINLERNSNRLERVLNRNYHYLGIFLDARCKTSNSTNYLHEATKYFAFDETHKWLIATDNLEETVEFLDDSVFNVLTDVVVVNCLNDNYELHDVYNPCKECGGVLNSTMLGTWSEKSGINVTLAQNKYARRLNMHGIKIRAGVLTAEEVENGQFEDHLIDYDKKWIDRRKKFLYAVLLDVVDLYNFTMEIVKINKSTKFNDHDLLFSALLEKQIDVSIIPMMIDVERLNNADLIGPVWPLRTCFILRIISAQQLNMTRFLRPFASRTWFAVIIFFIFAIILIATILLLDTKNQLLSSFKISALLTIGALAQQGLEFVPSTSAGRLALLQIMFFSLIILNHYTADLTKDRLLSVADKIGDSLIDLADSNYAIGLEENDYVDSLLQASDEEVKYFHEKRLAKLSQVQKYFSLEEGLNRVMRGGFAYLSTTEKAYPYIEAHFDPSSICEITEVQLFQTALALWARKNSPFTELLKIGLIKMYNMGLYKRQINRWSSRRPHCPEKLLIAYAVSIHETIPALAFLAMALALSLSICLMEYVAYRILNRRRAAPSRRFFDRKNWERNVETFKKHLPRLERFKRPKIDYYE